MRTISTCVVACVFALGLSCGVTDEPPGKSVPVSANSLGVASIQTDRVTSDGNDVFTLRCLSADGHQLASIRLTIGIIAGLPTSVPGSLGSEIKLTAAGTSNRMLSRETHLFHLSAATNPNIAGFLALNEVKSALKLEANILVDAPSSAEKAYSSFYDYSCDPSILLNSPAAQECCSMQAAYDDGSVSLMDWFQRPGDGGNKVPLGNTGDNVTMAVFRYAGTTSYGQAYPQPCTAADKVSPCSGTACVYGPQGFATGVYSDPNYYEEDYYGNDSDRRLSLVPS
jgi:hypothetical protein